MTLAADDKPHESRQQNEQEERQQQQPTREQKQQQLEKEGQQDGGKPRSSIHWQQPEAGRKDARRAGGALDRPLESSRSTRGAERSAGAGAQEGVGPRDGGDERSRDRGRDHEDRCVLFFCTGVRTLCSNDNERVAGLLQG